ncbi:hypothetical protein KKC88_04440 [Patescibacteria group bacterium]|nr:hypothetical protein [Patescibacteria group bacterium]MBU1673981.1 hypothetical protein [Patescibacteria group bacterium]MBU1962945.1 hypothetical protein [Patescibacteria group bacterium]
MKKIFLFPILGILLFTINFLATPSTKAFSTATHPIVIDNILMGGSGNDVWIDASYGKYWDLKGKKYKLYKMRSYIGKGTGSGIYQGPPSMTEIVRMKNNGTYLNNFVAIRSNWKFFPQKIRKGSKKSPTYKKVIKKILRRNDLGHLKPKIKQIYKVDLDGNGTKEKIIHASNIDFNNPNYYQEKNTYSVVFVRKLVNGKKKNIILRKSFYTEDGDFEDGPTYSHRIRAIGDFNGDGRMEVVVETRYYEGTGFSIFEVKKKKAVPVLSNGSGA